MDIFKNVCTCIVILQAFVIIGLFVIFTINDKWQGKQNQEGPRIGNRAFCLLTDQPCIYADNSGNTCEDCPAAQKHIYTEEKNVDKVRRIQDEGRAD